MGLGIGKFYEMESRNAGKRKLKSERRKEWDVENLRERREWVGNYESGVT